LQTRGLVQVSMNLVNYEVTGLQQAYEAVRAQAKTFGVGVVGTEIVGLVPESALDKSAEYFYKLEDFSKDKILESRLQVCMGKLET